MKHFIFVILAAILIGSIPTASHAQKKAPDYKITNIKIVPFNEQTGKFEDELTPSSDRSFFNDLSTSLFVTFAVSGESGSFEAGRQLAITVTEGKKVKLRKTEQVGLIGDGGRYYIPIFLHGAMCDQIKISARLTGQKTASSMTRSVSFLCGE